MKRNKSLKRFLAFLLCAAMLITYMPSSVYTLADDSAEPATTVEEPAAAPAPEKAEEPAPAPDPEPAAEPVAAQDDVDAPETNEAPASDVQGEAAPSDVDTPADELTEEPTEPEEELIEEEPEEEEGLNEETLTFNGKANSVSVKVIASPGTFPKGTEMKVTSVAKGEVKDAVENAMGGEVGDFRAVDITFYADGKEVQPKKDVNVKLTTSALDTNEDLSVVHVEGNGGEVMDLTKATDSMAQFKTDGFSIYVVAETAADTYNFVVNGETVRTQKVVAGDNLYEPETPTSSNAGKFLGWFVGDTELVFNASGVYTVQSVSNSTVTVEARFGQVFYATFRDQEGNIVARIEVPSGSSLTNDKVPTIVPKNSNQNFAGWTATQGGSTAVEFPYDMISNVEFYPVIQEGFWVHYDANRAHAGMDDNVSTSYTSPEFVVEGGKATKPTDPVSNYECYTFEGWYTDPACTNRFNFNTTAITSDITLYANWNRGQAKYNVIIWEQKVTDNKNATGDARSWDYLESIERTANIGSTVSFNSLPNNIKNRTIEGFTQDSHDSSITVAADGSSVLNIYYRRNLMTIDFYVYQRNNGTWNYSEPAMYSDYWGNYHVDSHAKVWRTLTGLYGQTFAQAAVGVSNASDYVWPAQYTWFDGVQTFQSMESTFKSTNDETYYCMGGNGDYTVYHVKQKADGTWPTESQVKDGSGQYSDIAHMGSLPSLGFSVTNKYDTFNAVAYSKKTYDGSEAGTGRTSATPGTTYVTGSDASVFPLYIYHARKNYTIEFYDGTVKKESAQKRYEESLAGYADKTLTPADPAHYTFGGWSFTPGIHDATQAIDWSQQTMPARTLSVYAIWVPVGYHVLLDLGAADASMSAQQSTSLWLDYGETIDGTYMEAATRPDHVLVGWFDPNGTAWNYENGITADLCDEGPTYDSEYNNYYYTLHLTAKWRLSKAIKVTYDVGTGSGTFVDDEMYLQYGSAKVLDGSPEPADNHHVFVGWADLKGNVYQPGDTITIDDEDLLVTDPETGVITLLLTAVYGTIVPTASITYHATYNDQTSVDDNNGNYYGWNDTVTLPADTFTREGYKIVGWSKSANGSKDFDTGKEVYVSAMSTTIVEDDNKLNGNNDLYAVWAPIEYTVEFDKNASDATGTMNPQEFTYDVEQALTANAFSRGANYEFLGWSTDPNATAKTYSNAEVVKNLTATDGATVTLYAVWKTNKLDYTIHHYLKGTTTKVKDDETGSAAVGETVNATLATTYNGKTVTKTEDSPTSLTIAAEGTNEISIYYTLALNIVAESASKIYDGTPLYGDFTDIIGALTPDLDTNTIRNAIGAVFEVQPSITNAGTLTYPNAEQQAAINEGIPSYYEVNYTVGTLRIDPRHVTVVIDGHTDTKPYTGSPQSVTGYDVTITVDNSDGNAFPSSYLDVAFFGNDASKTATGTEAGTYDMGLTPEQFQLIVSDAGTTAGIDYNSLGYELTEDFTLNNGWLKITPKKLEIHVKGAEKEVVYNGKQQTLGTALVYEVLTELPAGLSVGQDERVVQDAKGTNVGTYPQNNLTADHLFLDGEGADNYAATIIVDKKGFLKINPRPVVVTIGNNSKIYGDPDPDPLATVTVEVQKQEGESASDVPAAPNFAHKVMRSNAGVEDAGTYPDVLVLRKADGTEETEADLNRANPNYTFTIERGDFTIKAKKLEIHVKGAEKEVVYNGKQQTLGTALVYEVLTELPAGLSVGQDERVVQDAKGTNVGTYPQNNLTADHLFLDGEGADNYAATIIVDKKGFLKITALAVKITVKVEDKTVTYNGQEQATDPYEYTVTGNTDLFRITGVEGHAAHTGEGFSTFAVGTDAGTYTTALGTALNWEAEPDKGVDLNNFEIAWDLVNGTLTINKAPLTITTPSGTKVYDGTAITRPNGTVTGLVNGETATVNGTGSQTAVGSSQNGYTIIWGTAKESNYEIVTENLGTLTVTAAGGGGGGPAVVPGGPAGPTVVPDEPVPAAEPEPQVIPDEPTPLAEGVWAVINLISAILTALGAIIALFRKKEEDDDEDNMYKEEDEDDNRGKKMLAAKIAGALAGVAAPITFILTEDMSLPMALVDKWTVLMVIMLAVQVLAAALNKKASKLDDEEETAEDAAN